MRVGEGEGAGGSGGGSGAPNPSAPASGGAGGTAVPTDWRAALTGEFEPLRGEKSLEVFKGKDFNEVGPALVKTLVSSQKMIGNSVRVPGPEAKPEEITAFREKIGVPKDVSGYKDVKLPDIPGKTWDAAAIDNVAKPAFHKMGLTPQQAQDALTLFATYTQQTEKAMIESFFQGQDALMDKWGLAFDSNTKLAYRTLEKFFPAPFIKIITTAGLDAHPDFIKGLYDIGVNFAESGIVDGDGIGAPTVDDLEKQIIDTRAEAAKKHPNGADVHPPGSASRTELEKKLENLYKARYPETPVGRGR